MQPITVLTCLAIVLAGLAGPSDSAVTTIRSRALTPTPLPARRVRLPFTPVRDSTRKERLPYTPVKPATTRRPGSPSYLLRTTTTTRKPFPVRTTPKPCNCRCNLSDYKPLCAVSSGERTTFANQCQLNCQSCLDNKDYKVVMEKECSK